MCFFGIVQDNQTGSAYTTDSEVTRSSGRELALDYWLTCDYRGLTGQVWPGPQVTGRRAGGESMGRVSIMPGSAERPSGLGSEIHAWAQGTQLYMPTPFLTCWEMPLMEVC